MSSITRDEWTARQRPRAARSPQNLEVMVREAVRIEALTGDENWDFLLSYIEAAIKGAEAQIKSEDAKLRSPYLVNDEAIRMLKAQITRLEARAEALREVLMLPRLLRERGDLARTQIADLANNP